VIDLHCHLLPGVDDGSRSVQQSVEVLQQMARLGVTDICLTPHALATQASVPAAHDAAFEALRVAAPDTVRLHRGAEVMLDRPLPAEVASERRLTLGGTRYILVEFTRLVTFQTVQQALTMVTEIGLRPVLAHPERYLCCRPETVRRCKETGALMQVDATTLLSERGRGERARQLITHGLADLLAGDNHGDDRTLAPGRQALVDHGGAAQADLLTIQNPKAILDDELTSPVPPLSLRGSILRRLRQLFESEDR